MGISRCSLPPHKWGEAYDRNIFTRNYIHTISFTTRYNYHYVCLNYSNSYDDKQTKINQ